MAQVPKPVLAAVDDHVAAIHKLRRFVKSNQELIGKYIALQKGAEKTLDAAKALARECGTPGQTVVLLEGPDAKVQVIGGYEGTSYDYREARDFWTEKILAQVIIIDPKKVAALIELGTLSPEDAARAACEAVPLAPKVKIEVRGK